MGRAGEVSFGTENKIICVIVVVVDEQKKEVHRGLNVRHEI